MGSRLTLGVSLSHAAREHPSCSDTCCTSLAETLNRTGFRIGVGPCGHCTPLEFFPRQRPARFLDAATLAEQRAEGYLRDTAATMVDPSLYALNQQAVSWLTQELIAWLTAGWPVAHTVNYRNDTPTIERIPMQAFGGGGGQDCPLCSHAIGTCHSTPLPTTRNEPCSPFTAHNTGAHHG